MTDDDVYSEEESDDDAFFDELPDDALFTSVWLLTGITGSVFGHLTFANGRIAFTTNDGCVFNVPLSEVSDVEFPWYYFDVSVKFRIELKDTGCLSLNRVILEDVFRMSLKVVSPVKLGSLC